ncbi:MAG: hypothetical protein CMC55_00485 [Flavobacteriaceae bacterium]|nr:hypothetical protein [Flavobacteriaceae bacterium]
MSIIQSTNKEFAVFIMVHGRPDKMWTYHTLRKQGYTGKIYLVADDLDESRFEYKKIYGDELLIFDKNKAALEMDSGDNTGDLRSTLFSANKIFDLATELDIKYFYIMCDDYTRFDYSFKKELQYNTAHKPIKNMNYVFDCLLEFYISSNIMTLAMGQGGDFIGGPNSGLWKKQLKRKAMNSFLCSTERRFEFIGRMNEDVTTYVNLGSKGKIFLTTALLRLEQMPTQKQKGGLTDLYLQYGTYIKSFFSVMYNPSCVKIATMGISDKRIHHRVKWNNTVPVILEEKYKK